MNNTLSSGVSAQFEAGSFTRIFPMSFPSGLKIQMPPGPLANKLP